MVIDSLRRTSLKKKLSLVTYEMVLLITDPYIIMFSFDDFL